MKQQKKRPVDRYAVQYWVLAVVLVLTGAAAPVGFCMISLWLMGQGVGRAETGEGEREPVGARTNLGHGTGPAAALNALTKRGRVEAAVGGAFLLLALVSAGMEARTTAPLVGFDPALLYGQVLIPLCVGGIALGCLLAGLVRLRQVGRFRRCLKTLGRTPEVAVTDLARAAALSPRQTRRALEEMLALGILPRGQLDRETDRLVLAGGRGGA